MTVIFKKDKPIFSNMTGKFFRDKKDAEDTANRLTCLLKQKYPELNG